MKNNKRNLKKVWRLLDDACGSLDNAATNIMDIEGMPESITEDITKIDISEIVNLKNKIEELLEQY